MPIKNQTVTSFSSPRHMRIVLISTPTELMTTSLSMMATILKVVSSRISRIKEPCKIFKTMVFSRRRVQIPTVEDLYRQPSRLNLNKKGRRRTYQRSWMSNSQTKLLKKQILKKRRTVSLLIWLANRSNTYNNSEIACQLSKIQTKRCPFGRLSRTQ